MGSMKEGLDIMGKLSVGEEERVKRMVLSGGFVKCLNIEDLVGKEGFGNGGVWGVCGCMDVVGNGDGKDGREGYVCKDCGKWLVIGRKWIVCGRRKELWVWEE